MKESQPEVIEPPMLLKSEPSCPPRLLKALPRSVPTAPKSLPIWSQMSRRWGTAGACVISG